MKLQAFVLISGLVFILSGCTEPPPPQAKPFIASSVITNDNVFHLLYTVNNKNLHHLTQTDNGWKEEIFDFKEELVKAFVKDNNICFSFLGHYVADSSGDGIVCIQNSTLIYIDANMSFGSAWDILASGKLFTKKNDYIWLYDPFTKEESNISTAYNPLGYTYPYLESNNTWDSHTLVSYLANSNQLQCDLWHVEENGTVENLDTIIFDASDIPNIDRWMSIETHYVQVKGKHYITPRTGVVVDVIDGTTLQVASAADYFGDDNLKILQDIDAVDANGTFHHLRTIQSYEHQELIYEKYVPSQTEPVYSEVIYKDKVEGETW